MVKSAEVTSK